MGDLAAFVGRNESGKTTILQALTLLNRTESVSDLDLCDEMNEELKSEINIVEGEFELTKKEVSLIKEKFPNLPHWSCKKKSDKIATDDAELYKNNVRQNRYMLKRLFMHCG